MKSLHDMNSQLIAKAAFAQAESTRKASEVMFPLNTISFAVMSGMEQGVMMGTLGNSLTLMDLVVMWSVFFEDDEHCHKTYLIHSECSRVVQVV